mgnify:CR=1 FL=1
MGYLVKLSILKNEIKQIENEIEITPTGDYSMFFEKEIVGILEIPKIKFKSIIKEGTELENLKNSVGHFKETSLFEGNVGIAGHNRRI